MSQGKQHEPTERERKQVETLAGCGVSEDNIARVIGITKPTLRKWYAYELDTGHIKANSMVAQSLYNKAMGNGQGAVTACIFWLKVRAGWQEPKPWEQPVVGKKELQAEAAQQAGGLNTEWSGDLDFERGPDNRPN